MNPDDPSNAPDPSLWAEPASSSRVVVIAASAGGLPAFRAVLSSLPADFPAAIVLVQHRGEEAPEVLPALLDASTALKVRHARSGDLLEAGTAYLCPPGIHIVAEQCLRLVDGPRLAHVRPSADLMLRSAARAYGNRAIAVVLSGCGSDGALGCKAIAEAGGTVVAQDPSSSAHGDMPAAAIARGRADRVLPVQEIGEALRRLVQEPHPIEGDARPLAFSPAPTRAIRVLLVDDHRILLDGLRALLRSEPDIEVVAEAEDGLAAVRLASELSPDVVVLDIAMPQLDGIDATRHILARNPRAIVIALSAGTDAQAVRKILEAGAKGYLRKNAAFSHLASSIRSAFAGTPQPSSDEGARPLAS